MNETIEHLEDLHDCTVQDLSWTPSHRRLALAIEDIYWNHEGLSDYKGPTPGTFTFLGVTRFDANVRHLDESLMIIDSSVSRDEVGRCLTTITFWNGDTMRVKSERIELQTC